MIIATKIIQYLLFKKNNYVYNKPENNKTDLNEVIYNLNLLICLLVIYFIEKINSRNSRVLLLKLRKLRPK